VSNLNFEKYLKERYEGQVKWYDRRSILNQRLYRYLQWTIIILAAIDPVLILSKENYLQILGAVFAILIAIISAAQKTFKYQENWINYRTTCEMLKKEKVYYDHKIHEYSDLKDPESYFVSRVEKLISRENTYWVSTYKKEYKSEE
jgi:hypothetical protein